ncbi:ESCO1/2 acetyl-transferase-domain-containing protein [Fimicolochytrium jonesii]|uniref:ESCO1/2 acetyl-transferase-domain-containing protein n=1 Tax=Fimicolochytrium jonesii TaxID=1396493 RepID=UPI0022FEBC93|nr:ESCO1/2 acetyl-transferase-domain-containing protein [Fimicolochytrium jonesii]KAI8827187.1 ESCO1/2 acetyl-transferase-domain-containing protein [Fimicolochytrium jonesii]
MHFFQPAANESGKKATTSASTAGGKGAAPKFVESAASAQASQGSATVPTKRSLEQSLSSPTLTSTSPRPHWHTPSSKKPPLLSSTSPPTTLPPSTTPPTTYAQLHLDLGQKSLTACPTCNMSYARSRPDDVATHARYHAAAVEGVMWGPASSSSSASAGERVVREFADGAKVVCVEREGCGVKVWKKALSVVILVNTELGAAAPAEVDEGSKIFLYITPSRRVAGCVLVERITTAYRVVVSDTATDIQPENNDPPREELVKNGSVAFRSTCPVPASCGISRIWVLKSERRKGVAGRMLDVVRTRFVFGYTLSPTDDMAFSQPTMAGKALAERMCGGRKDFLVY